MILSISDLLNLSPLDHRLKLDPISGPSRLACVFPMELLGFSDQDIIQLVEFDRSLSIT